MVSNDDLNGAAIFVCILQAASVLRNLGCTLSHDFNQLQKLNWQNIYCHCKGKNKEYISHRDSFFVKVIICALYFALSGPHHRSVWLV